MIQGQEFGDNPGNGKPNTAIGNRIFPDLPVPPDQLPADDNREAYRKAKVIVQVWDEPNKTKTVCLRLFEPDDPSTLLLARMAETKLHLFAKETIPRRWKKHPCEMQKTERRPQSAKLLKPVAVGSFETHSQEANLDASVVVVDGAFCFAHLAFRFRN